ncbi:MAG: ABC transporter ATP-binding protein, partial [Oribacterium sp.]|nr:ABC transporter ATP-binding protein [Oribacterium sp.]
MSEEEMASVPKVTSALIKRVFSYLKPYWKQLIMVLLCIALSSVASLMPSILTGKIIDEGLIGRNMKLLIIYIAASFGVTVLASLIGVGESYI